MIVVVVAVLITVGGAILARGEIADRVVRPAPVESTVEVGSSMTQVEHAFYDFVGPRLARMAAEGNELVRLAEGRSRNLIELQTRGERITDAGQEIDEYIAQFGVPIRFAKAMETYRAATETIREGIGEARSGFLSFDWDRVAVAVDHFRVGAEGLAHSLGALQVAAGNPSSREATPARGKVHW
ncbi:MAG: hypothetical protein ACRDJW_16665 [Thermomicrobiales bacterium]